VLRDCSLRWKVFSKIWGVAFPNDLRSDLAGFSAIFLLGRAGEPVRALLLARKEKLPVQGCLGFTSWSAYSIGKRGCDCGDWVAALQVKCAIGWGREQVGSRSPNGGLFFSVGVAGLSVFSFTFGCTARSSGTQAARMAEGSRMARQRRRDAAWVCARSTDDTERERFSVVDRLLVAHWFLVLLVYLWSRIVLWSTRQDQYGDAMLVMALRWWVGVQLRAWRGSQVASFLAYTHFWSRSEPAAAASIVLWLITFAACSLAGVPLLVHEGFS